MVEDLLLTLSLIGLLAVVATGAATFLVVRRVRRRIRAWRGRANRGWSRRAPASALGPQALLRRSGSVAATTVGSPGWWAAQSRRHRMWRAVSSAEHAVRSAHRAQAPLGDLPALMGRLGAAAGGVDVLLRAAGRQGLLHEEDRRECDRIVATADEVRAAALGSLRSGSHADTDTVVSAVRIEVAALAAGVRAARGPAPAERAVR